MVKRGLTRARNVNRSFTKPSQPGAAELQNGDGFVDWIDWARALFALIATLALIVGAAYVARRLGMMQGGAQGPKRLKISESLMLDPRRRLVIVRCDDREHVLLLGPAGDVVVSEKAAKPDLGLEGQS